MKNFLKKISLFILIPVVLTFIFDLWLHNMNTIYKEKYTQALLAKDSIEVLILGNSHANYGVDPAGFDSYAFNLANVNQSLYFDKQITLSILDQLPNLKYVFISLDYHSLYFSDQGLRNVWAYYGNGVKYKNEDYFLADLSPFLFGYTPKFATSLLKKSIINKIKYRKETFLDFDVEDGVDISKPMKKGFIYFDGVNENIFNENFYQARARLFNNVVENPEEMNEILVDLEDFIKVLKSYDITPILFTTPTYQVYNQFLISEKVKENTAIFQNLCDKYDIVYLDYMDLDEFDKSDFSSCDHLNHQGALKFGKILNDYLVQIKN